MSTDVELLNRLKQAVDRAGAHAWVDVESRVLPVLYVAIPRTSLREIVIVTYGERGEGPPRYQWDGRVSADVDELAAALAAHAHSYPDLRAPRRWP